MITQEYLKSILHYDYETGLWTCLGIRKNGSKGKILNTVNKTNGYIIISILNKGYLAHRLAWLYVTGKWPENEIDHKDRNVINNKWENLREANRQENSRNIKVRSHNKLGVKGVSQIKNKYKAVINIGEGKDKYLGYFDTIEEAKEAYNDAALKYFGQFAKT